MAVVYILCGLSVLLFIICLLLAINNIYLGSLIFNIYNGVMVFSPRGKILKFNKSFLDIFKYEAHEIKKLNVNDLFVDHSIVNQIDIKNIRGNETVHINGIKKNKDIIFLNMFVNKLTYLGKDYILAEITDIEKQNINENKLREGQRLISILLSNLPGLVYLAYFEPDLTVKFLSDGCYKLTGFSPSDFINNKRRNLMNIIYEDDKESVIKERLKAINEKTEFQVTYRIITGDNTVKWVWERGKPVFDIRNKLVAIGGSINDVTEYKEMENKLAEEKERLLVTLRSIGDGVITTDTNGRIILINNVAEKLTGWTQEEAYNKPIQEVFIIINENTREQVINPIHRVLEFGLVIGLANHTALISKDGTERLIADSGAPIKDKQNKIIGVVLVFRDITDKNKMEMEMSKIIKLESLGVLAGGIAHDFNNILTALLGNINLAKYYSKDKKILELLAEAEKAAYNSKSLTDQLLTFSKGGEPVKKVGNINKLLKESVLFSLRGANIKTEFELDEDFGLIEFDEGQMNQVFNNLAINARQAMAGGGLLRIISKKYLHDDNKPFLAKGEYFQIIFEDQGVGIPKENIQKIYDPFFTTKKDGKGLGLSSCYSIINKHNGYITVESEVGKGTKFVIYLPALRKDPSKTFTFDDKEEIIKGKGRILFMDDEADIRSYVKRALEFLGYDVELARDGWEVLEKYKRSMNDNEHFDCVVLDITIQGGMGGKETLLELNKINPDVVAIVTSGYSNDPVIANYKDYGFKNAIIKPFKIEDLSKLLSIVLTKKNNIV